MSLNLNETFRVSAPPDRVWRFLKNPADVVTCLPGAELTDTIDAQTYAGRVKVKVGPITAKYAGKATLVQVDDATRRMQIVAEGKESSGSGSARMTLNGGVVALPDGTSEVSVEAAIDIAGRVMQFGRGLIESVNKQLFKQFAESVRTKLEAAHDAAPPPNPGDAAAPNGPSAAPPAATSITPPPDVQAGGSEASSRPSSGPVPATGAASAASGVGRRESNASRAPIAQGEELRAIPLLWKALRAWLAGRFGGRR